MAISRVAGQMLQSNLERDGVNLAIETDLAYFDVGNSRVGISTNAPAAELDVNGNVLANNLGISATISATGNITGGNLITAGLATVTGNVTGGNIATAGLITATGNVTGGNLVTSGQASATGNVTAGNVLSLGVLSATANILGADLSVSGNVIGAVLRTGNIVIPATGNVNLSNTWINDLSDPAQNQDAATKFYVDTSIGNIGNIANFTFVNTTISTSTANANILIDPNGTGYLQIVGTNGFVVPAGTTGERPGSAPQGTLRFNTFLTQLEVWDGSAWESLGADSVISNQTITPDGSSATYTLDQASTAAGILVSINGVLQTPGVDYTVTGSPSDQITFTSTPLTTDIVQIRFVSSISEVTGLTNSSGASSVRVTDANTIVFEIDTANVATITANAVFNLANSHSLQLPSYDVANATALTNVAAGQIIYVTNGDSGNPCLAVYSGGSWRRVALGATIST